MEKTSLYVKKILALVLSASFFYFIGIFAFEPLPVKPVIAGSLAFLLFAYLDYRITGEKPRFLFGMNQSDTYLNKKGGFWHLFKWILNLFGFIYDLIVWTIWGVVLLFALFVDLLLLIKTIAYWILHALIWFLRQLFPPVVFIFRMFMHYILNWTWWIYQLAVRNVKIAVHKNFYFIALWGSIPALFIVFLFYAMSQVVGIPQLLLLSAVFAMIPIVWSFGEIAFLRFEGREKDEYTAVRDKFRNGFDAVRSVLFYLSIVLLLMLAEILLNLLGWIPNLSMSLLGISLNLNMAISLSLVFLAIIVSFAGCILPTHILYHPEHENDLTSSLGFLTTISKKFLRYLFARIPITIFGSVLLFIPILIIAFTLVISDNIKNSVLGVKIEQLSEKRSELQGQEAHTLDIRMDRLQLYKEIPVKAAEHFAEIRNTKNRIDDIQDDLLATRELIRARNAAFDKEIDGINLKLEDAEAGTVGDSITFEIADLSSLRGSLEEEHAKWQEGKEESISMLEADQKELRSQRIQMPVLYFFVGILFAVFGGLAFAVYVAYTGNVYFELYQFREDERPSQWKQTLTAIREKDPNQPLLGFTFLVLLIALSVLILKGVIPVL